jgi:hypothetical protein
MQRSLRFCPLSGLSRVPCNPLSFIDEDDSCGSRLATISVTHPTGVAYDPMVKAAPRG